ncbi:MAG TPA: HEAT repeat domain-containing protein [Gemmataceae bacterium]|nr:HEAT repeat domain-containing protein [Gemmataceae bacterium]
MTRWALPAVVAASLLSFAPERTRGQEFLGKSVELWQENLAPTKSAAERRSAAFALGKLGKAAVNALAALAQRLDDPDAGVRETAAFAIGEICAHARVSSPQLLTLLSKRLKEDPEPMVRRSAAVALGSIGKAEPAVLASLDAAIKDNDPTVRQNVAWALGRMGSKAIGSLRRALKDGDSLVRRDAALALGRLSEDTAAEAIPELLACCATKDIEERKAVYAALVRLVGPEEPEARGPLLKGLKDREIEIRRNAALALANIGGPEAEPALPVLIVAWKEGDLNLRRQAILAIGAIGPTAKNALPVLRAALRDPDEEIRHNAAVSCIGLKSAAEPAVPDLAALLTNKGEADRVRAQAAVALARIGFVPGLVKAMPVVLQLVANPDEKRLVRERALWSVRVYLNNVEDRSPIWKVFTGILKQPKTADTKMLHYDVAYLLGMFQAKDAPEVALDVLLEFLQDADIKIYEPGSRVVIVGIRQSRSADGRVMAVDALQRIGAERVARRADIVAQLRALHADPRTFPDLAQKIKKLLPEIERQLKQQGNK